ncbi:MAG: PP2C family protein-serine/threonine phosphatase, partial [Anaerolineales bacterium]
AAKRQNLTEFLNSAPEEKIDLCCEDEREVQAHLHVIETTIEKAENQTLGLCAVCHGHVDPGLLEMDYTISVCLEHFSELERKRLEEELELSAVVQRALLPQIPPEIPGVELAAFTRPAAIVGGDYFDFFNFQDGTHGLVIADIPGHGVSAGMLMSSLQTAIRTMAPETDSPSEILERINRFYIHNIHFTTFVTIFLARFDPVTHTLTYASAGHNPPAVVNKRKAEVTWLKPTAPAIGLAEEFHSRTELVTLEHGDVLFLYTDGVTEAFNPTFEQFGSQRLAELLGKNVNLGATDIIQIVRQGLETFGDGHVLEDDTTFVALKLVE